MNQQSQFSNNQFLEIASSSSSNERTIQTVGNVLKNTQLEPAQFQKIEVDAEHYGEPSVLIHRNGEHIESIEFICTCGKSKTLKFEYDAE